MCSFSELFAKKLLEEDEEAVQGGVDVTVIVRSIQVAQLVFQKKEKETSRTAATISLLPANGWLGRLILGLSVDSGSSVRLVGELGFTMQVTALLFAKGYMHASMKRLFFSGK